MTEQRVRAAGGVVWRPRAGGEIDVVLVHRPRYDDWTLPKGKVDPGESDEDAARREVEEEASLGVRLGPELVSTTYLDGRGRSKLVRYWAMSAVSGSPRGAHEVDDARWVALADAGRWLTYPRDREVLASLGAAIGAAMALSVTAIDHLVLTVADVERSLDFYCGLLGLPGLRLDQWRRGEAPFPSVRINDYSIIDLLAGRPTGVNIDHFCLVVSPTDLDAVAASGAFEVLDGPGPRYGARGEGTSLYVADPDGNTVELRHYP